jgi:Transglutaminase-like superfamily
MWKLLHRFSRLDHRSRALFLRGVVLISLVSISLRFRGFRATQGTLRRRLRATVNSAASSKSAPLPVSDDVARIVRMMQAATRHSFGSPNCLEVSLVLWYLLNRRGMPSAIRIGTRKIDGRLEAHAWVERNGVALNEFDQAHLHYAPFDAAFSSLADTGASSF